MISRDTNIFPSVYKDVRVTESLPSAQKKTNKPHSWIGLQFYALLINKTRFVWAQPSLCNNLTFLIYQTTKKSITRHGWTVTTGKRNASVMYFVSG